MVSQTLEYIVVAQVMDYLDHHKIIYENQHGFRSRRSCESQLLLTTDDIVMSMNQIYQVDMAILDFAKAFDKVSHQRLYFLVFWDHGFHCGTLKLLEGH